MIEIPERVMKIHEVQAPSITGEKLSKHRTKRKEEKELSRVGVVLLSLLLPLFLYLIIAFVIIFNKKKHHCCYYSYFLEVSRFLERI